MAKGAEAKKEIFAKIQQIFPNSFWEDEGKIMRIPLAEAGERVEIKLQLTAAKNNLGGDSVPSAFGSTPSPQPKVTPPPAETNDSIEITQAEKDNIAKMIKALNL